ncbi:TadE/TadG family type IV pilus assembly protein, partial [Methylobacterium trifolii]|uniref:TadE/TadG family type IV pilus assembly protein n=1 Tax=Methylobacterium trifolii TaxID=1003092 RepID=UPI001EE0625C
VPFARLHRAWTAFARDRRGVTVVEFGLLALPFLGLLCVVVEAALLVFAQQTLDVALARATRALRTGDFQGNADGSDPASRLRKVMCGGTVVFFRCEALRLDMTRATTFKAAQVALPYDSQKKTWAAGFGTRFDCPQGDDIIALRAAVVVPRLFAFLDFTNRSMGPGAQLMFATAIFRAEPYVEKTCQ